MSSAGAPGLASNLDTSGRVGLTTAFAGRPPPPGLLGRAGARERSLLEDRQRLPGVSRVRSVLGSRFALRTPRGVRCVR